jgi:alpha-ketoglutarate-dependent taurine dioxygenase
VQTTPRTHAIPFLVQPSPETASAVAWAERHRDTIRDELADTGAVLLRGFDVGNAEAFADVLDRLGLSRMPYPRGTSPRTPVGPPLVYTSTETRPDVAIPMHSEMSYTSLAPSIVAFCCIVPAETGGETPLADLGAVGAALPAPLVERWSELGLLHEQTVPPDRTAALSKSWKSMFDTEDRAEVEAACRAQHIEVTWLEDDWAHLAEHGSARRAHPLTGEVVWFNQANAFHPHRFRQTLPATEAALVERNAKLAQSFSVSFGDGTVIPDEDIDAITAAFESATVTFEWEAGDVLLLDNYRVAHGRRPFTGERRVLAALIS